MLTPSTQPCRIPVGQSIFQQTGSWGRFSLSERMLPPHCNGSASNHRHRVYGMHIHHHNPQCLCVSEGIVALLGGHSRANTGTVTHGCAGVQLGSSPPTELQAPWHAKLQCIALRDDDANASTIILMSPCLDTAA